MSTAKRPANLHKAYHAHVYFDDATNISARALCEKVSEKFNLKVGAFHQKPVGPHPLGSCQIVFGTKDFETFIPWLDENRNGLTVLVHGLTGDNLKDHTDFAYWLGQAVEINWAIFNKA